MEREGGSGSDSSRRTFSDLVLCNSRNNNHNSNVKVSINHRKLLSSVKMKNSTLFSTTLSLSMMVLLGMLIYLTGSTWGHVGLTFPPARKYDLDFLDKIRTKPPCGMPKGDLRTSLMAGSKLNVTWHLSYPHRGGYRLELMDGQERALLDLTPKTEKDDYIKGDPTAQFHVVELPKNFTCEDCTIRLLREASEWSGQYRFWSCADVDIVEPKKYKETCMGHGRPIAGRCVCSKGFGGSRCQYEDECDTDNECNGNGKCIDLGGTALPKKQCFCNPGFHGEKCSKKNAVKLPSATSTLDLTRHTKRVLSDRMTLYYRTIPAAKDENKELEFVLVINGTSYGAIGWRPSSFDKTCKRWPYISNSTSLSSSSAPKDRSGKNARLETAASEPKAEAEPEHDAKAESEPEHDAKAESEPEHDAKAEAEPEHDAKAEAEPEHDAKAEAEPEHDATSEPEPENSAVGHHKKKGGRSDSQAEPEPEATSSESTSVSSTSSRSSSKKPSKPQARADPQGTDSSAGKLRAKLSKSTKLPEGEEVNVETSSIYVTRNGRSKRSPEDAKAEPEPESESEPEPEKTASEPEPESSAAEPETEPKSEPETTHAEPESEAESEAEPSGGAGHHHHGSHSGIKEYKPSEWAPKGDFHSMDCIDLIMGGARGSLSRIRDYYTRDRSTPRLDAFWGGKEDITSSTGWEKDGQTTLIFRRKVRSTDEPDHNLEGELHVIWARGQEPGEYYHKPRSGLEVETPAVPNFYAPDEIKYHGHGMQRGVTRIDFLAHQEPESESKTKVKVECGDYFSYPPGCSNEDKSAKPCTYKATWAYKQESDSVQFTIESRQTNKWTGIAFSDSPEMRNSDAILGWVTSVGQFFLMDTYMNSYAAPILDANQDVSGISGKYEDGIAKLTFSRPVKSTDTEKDVSLDKCRFFLFPTDGGTYHAVSKKIRKHEQTPIASPQKICVPTTCRRAKPPKAPAQLRYTFDIKLTGGLGNNWQPPPKNSEDFTQLGNRLRRDLETRFKGIAGYNTIQLEEVRRDGEEVVAKLNLMVTPQSELANMEKVKQVLEDTISTGKAGALQIDPKYLQLVLQQPDVREEDDDDSVQASHYFSGQKFWIVLGCVAALILLALVQAGLTIYKTSGKSSSHKGSPSSGSGMAWRDYSETNYGYNAYDEKNVHMSNAMPLQTHPANGTGHPTGQSSRNQHHHHQQHQHETTAGGHYATNHHGNGHHHHTATKNGGYHGGGVDMVDGPRGHGNGGGGALPPSYSLPRTAHQGGGQHVGRGGGGGGGLGGGGADFYFMPSQRKYSGEVVRVQVGDSRR